VKDGTRVRYTPKGEWAYPHLSDKTGTVQFTNNLGWVYVHFDNRAGKMSLPCHIEELEEL
jgi:hypothetical protein